MAVQKGDKFPGREKNAGPAIPRDIGHLEKVMGNPGSKKQLA